MLSLLLFLAPLVTDNLPSDTLTAQVASKQLIGETHDLSVLDIHCITLKPGESQRITAMKDDELVIVKDGMVMATVSDSIKNLNSGGVLLFAAGVSASITNNGSVSASFYRFLLRSRAVVGKKAAHSILLDWSEMTMKKTDKGESRQIFDQPA